MIIGLTPDADGVLPEPDVQRLKEWGDEISRRFSNPVASTSGKGNKLHLKLAENQKINHVILQEDISKGERVRKFRVEGKTKNGWKEIVAGSCIGNKFIKEFETIDCSEVRLILDDFVSEPLIQNLSVFYVE